MRAARPRKFPPPVRWSLRRRSEILPDSLEERMTQLALGGFRPVLDFGEQRWFDPDGAMRDLPGVGLRPADQRLEPGLQLRGRRLVEPMVDLAGIEQVLALAPAKIDAVEFV